MASKTFAELYADAVQQADEIAGSGAATALQIIKRGINEAYAEVGSIRDWDTLKNSDTFSASQNTDIYTPVTASVSVCRIRRVVNLINQTTNQRLDEVTREQFEYQYPYIDPTSTNSQGSPLLWMPYDYTSNRDLRVRVYPPPNGTFTIEATFYEEPLELVNDTDIPRIPDQYHYGLSYLGVAKYFEYQKDAIASYYRQLHEQYKQKILDNEWGEVTEMPQMFPQQPSRAVVVGKVGRIYNR